MLLCPRDVCIKRICYFRALRGHETIFTLLPDGHSNKKNTFFSQPLEILILLFLLGTFNLS
jgi:hypothetical protein